MYSVETISVLDSDMEVFLFKPREKAPNPAIILAQHIPIGHTGIENDEFTLKTARRFADNGFYVAVPFIFHWWPKTAEIGTKRDESRDDWTLADIKAANNLLIENKEVDSHRIGIVGHCWGGRVAWLGACHLSTLKACAVFYGGNIKISRGEGNSAPLELSRNIKCPVIGIFGNEDTNPSPADVDDYAAALTLASVNYIFHKYDGAGHAFQNFMDPERFREEQSEDAWSKVLNFLALHLK